MPPKPNTGEIGGSPEKNHPSLDDRLQKRGLEIQAQAAFFRFEDYVHLFEVLTIENVARIEEDELRPAEEHRLRRMMGLARRDITISTSKSDEQRFWSGVENWAGEEIEKAAGFADDLSDMPKSWQPALKSLTRLQKALKTQRDKK